jgi:exosortase E/protease (VPEID-CTERM system)
MLTVFNQAYHRIAAIIFATTFLLTSSVSASRSLATLGRQPRYLWWPWTVLHAVAVIFFTRLTAHGFGTETGTPALSPAWLAAWITSGIAILAFWLLVMAPARAWVRVLRLQWLNLLVAVGAGTAVWVGGLLAQQLWIPLAGGTLRLSKILLSFVYPDVTYEPAQGLVGTPAFLVEIYPVCSGYEGIALVTVFVATYLWIFRKALPFPRALVLLPIGIISIWLANVMRITTLIVIATSVSPEVAGQGFHSQAGWIAFSLVTIGLIAISHRWLAADERRPPGSTDAIKHPGPALLLPLMALMATTMVTTAASAGFDVLYPLVVVVTGTVLWHYRAAYRSLFGPWTWEPFALGALVFLVWVVLVPGTSAEGQSLADRLEGSPAWIMVTWVLFRVVGSVITVPFAEELAFRGYLIRKLISRDFERVRPGHFTWFSFIVSSLLFGLLHQHLLAGALAGAAFALALYRRSRVGDAILAHVSSNALIALAVLVGNLWGFWA